MWLTGVFMQFSKQQMRFFDKAAEVAAQSDFEQYHVGCIAVLKNRIISASSNKLKTHPKQAEYDKYREFNNNLRSDPKNIHSLHAEIACLSMIKERDINYKDVELYIVRLRRDRDYGLARPCAACMNLILNTGIRRIYYSTNISFAFESLF
jgi:deoxycytidylate deaminase